MRRRHLLGLAAVLAQWAAGPLAAADAQALYDRALAYLCGSSGLPRNPKEAARLLEQSAAQGHVPSLGLLGWMAMSGVGVPRDDARAARLLKPAAEGGDTAAQNNLGVLYALGSGVPHDHAQAERWFRAAADQGAEDAARNLDELLGTPRPKAGTARPAARLHPALLAAGCRPART